MSGCTGRSKPLRSPPWPASRPASCFGGYKKAKHWGCPIQDPFPVSARPAMSSEPRMDKKKERELEAAGWRIGTPAEFLGLSEDEATFIEMKLSLAEGLRAIRLEESLTQDEVATLVGSSQSRVAKMEAADPSVTVDLLVRTLLRLGAGRERVAELVGDPTPAPP